MNDVSKPGRLKLSREALHQLQDRDKPLAPQCALAATKDCCDGKGYVMSPGTTHARADLCSCVTECPACYGRAARLEGNVSKPCRTPHPKAVVNAINEATIPARYAQADLAAFRNFTGNGRQVVDKLRAFLETFRPRDSRGLIMGGPVGVGKTYLMAAIAKDLAKRGFTVRFTDFFQLLADIRAGFEVHKADAAHLAPLINVDVLLIDELGKGRNRDFDKTIIDQLVCGRYNQRKTIIASTNYGFTGSSGNQTYNVDLENLPRGQGEFDADSYGSLEDRVGKRVYSRLREMTNFFELTGDDYRRFT